MQQKIPNTGETASLGGLDAQFYYFAQCVYNELSNNKLEWIKVADPEAGKFDDIQYSTSNKIHAFQVKWTFTNAKVSLNDFKKILPDLAQSWRNLLKTNNETFKQVYVYLLTNKKLSKDDSISLIDGSKSNSKFFFENVWNSVKVEGKWQNVIDDIRACSKLSEEDFNEFIEAFSFHSAVEISEQHNIQSTLDIKLLKQQISSYASLYSDKRGKDRKPVKVYTRTLLEDLGWPNRFKTTFDHEFSIDLNKYEPIKSTLNELDRKIKQFNSGYLFLIGGPGTGKSTLLTQWIKSRNEHKIKYYAFDFTNINSEAKNNSLRGETTSLLFDLIIQINKLLSENRINNSSQEILPTKDEQTLKNTFEELLKHLEKLYKESQKKILILIDGLDHIPLECIKLKVPISTPKNSFCFKCH